jgi:hypothetical protein
MTQVPAKVPPRLHVLTARDCAQAVVLRRGPAGRTATVGWNRQDDSFTPGQWLKGRIYEHRSDLSPDGRHLVVFAGKGGTHWWTAVSRAPWLAAIAFLPQDSTWCGGGAFVAPGEVWLNGGGEFDALPAGELRQAPSTALPHSADGFHTGPTFVAMMQARGWLHGGGHSYAARLFRDLPWGGQVEMTFALGARNRAIVSNRYAVIDATGVRRETDWEWADLWQGRLQYAARGCLWDQDAHGEPRLIADFRAMTYEERRAPYAGVNG